jgi:hypothetical protein
MQGLICRKNGRGKYYIDGENLLGQVLTEDLFIDEVTGEIKEVPHVRTPEFLAGLDKLDAGVDYEDI